MDAEGHAERVALTPRESAEMAGCKKKKKSQKRGCNVLKSHLLGGVGAVSLGITGW